MTLDDMKNLTEVEQKELFSRLDSIRKIGKICNYSSVYGAGPAKIAQAAKKPIEEGKVLHDGYWKLNWSVKAIADEQCVFTCSRGHKWLINPINGFCYSLRKESDRFSTLCQGTGSFFFDMWLDNILEDMKKTFGVKKLTGQMHDEYITVFKDTEKNRKLMTDITHNAIKKVNEEFMLRRPLGCDVSFGRAYSEIH